ncbi:MAG: M28 family peptidase [Anaerolineales bacterium]|nr:M28 family peptidase [Anaerolineales bacterium]
MILRHSGRILVILLFLTLVALSAWRFAKGWVLPQATLGEFDGQKALQDVQYQTSLGARIPGSAAHAQIVEWMRSELESVGWQAEVQNSAAMGHPIQNIVASRSNQPPQIILAAHYDSRLVADRDADPGKRSEPVPGANDGASGVAVLLELARRLPSDTVPVWLVFFDAEDNGGLPGWDWILGSRAFVAALEHRPRAVVVVDMVGDADLNIHIERNSDSQLVAEIWAQAAALGYEKSFIPIPKYNILDDHTPFLEAGTPAAVLIDFDYPYWHTSADTADKVSAQSLKAVGETLLAWVIAQKGSR